MVFAAERLVAVAKAGLFTWLDSCRKLTCFLWLQISTPAAGMHNNTTQFNGTRFM